ncbi:poly-gamma-glutamate hydrolase family protein [Sinorhizobium sp. M4_45]|uniref:poly-gamma-glutamate hydrolase family protein n=1 Tax=Sinorhizobium sp. M4_45 TaxID=2037901 RepID=UPI000C99B81E|nr:poly-gamma-glutamate hydrolase family protein [Sinorhizobium sp. M4_45]PND27614.1 replication protein [Sinorhizobium sp. M4_45]
MTDRYRSFAELSASETEGVHFRVQQTARPSLIAIVAPHGGEIEPGTSQIALTIAANEFSVYCFDGLIAGRPHRDLHIASSLFDEPEGCKLVAGSHVAVGIHGRKDQGDGETVWVGGRDANLRNRIVEALQRYGFKALSDTQSDISGIDPGNICNRGTSGKGVQLEIPRTLRNELVKSPSLLRGFAEAVRNALHDHIARLTGN